MGGIMKRGSFIFAALLAFAQWGFPYGGITGRVCVQEQSPEYCGFFEHHKFIVKLYDNTWNLVQTQSSIYWHDPPCFDYSFENIPPGTYYVQGYARGIEWLPPMCTPPPTNEPWRPGYYPGVLHSTDATPIVVGEGQTVENIDFSLPFTTYILMGTNPPGFSVLVDGVSYSTPKYFEWTEGDVHTIGVEAYYDNPDGTRCYFREWRHGGPRIQNYTVSPATGFGSVPDTLIARFDYYYRLDIVSLYGHPEGGGWHKAWAPVTISVEDSVIEYTGGDSILHVFDHWEGSGYGAYTGPENPATFPMNGMMVERAIWKDQFPLVVEVNDTSLGSVEVTPCGIWQERDSTVYLRAISKEGCGFVGWQGAVTGTTDTVSVVMDTSKVVIAEFITESKIEEEKKLPCVFRLYGNYPNPFNLETVVRFEVPRVSDVWIGVYSSRGILLKTLIEKEIEPGVHEVKWDGTDWRGNKVSSGIYLLKMESGNWSRWIKMTLLK